MRQGTATKLNAAREVEKCEKIQYDPAFGGNKIEAICQF